VHRAAGHCLFFRKWSQCENGRAKYIEQTPAAFPIANRQSQAPSELTSRLPSGRHANNPPNWLSLSLLVSLPPLHTQYPMIRLSMAAQSAARQSVCLWPVPFLLLLGGSLAAPCQPGATSCELVGGHLLPKRPDCSPSPASRNEETALSQLQVA